MDSTCWFVIVVHTPCVSLEMSYQQVMGDKLDFLTLCCFLCLPLLAQQAPGSNTMIRLRIEES